MMDEIEVNEEEEGKWNKAKEGSGGKGPHGIQLKYNERRFMDTCKTKPCISMSEQRGNGLRLGGKREGIRGEIHGR